MAVDEPEPITPRIMIPGDDRARWGTFSVHHL
jgi:hypothetical protein